METDVMMEREVGVLPEGWKMVTIEDVCILNPPKSETKGSQELLCSFLPMADLGQGEMYFVPKTQKPIGEVYSGYTYFRNGDVLLAKVTPCFENGKSGIARDLKNGIGFGSSEYYVLRAEKEILPEYLYRIISSNAFLKRGAENMSGAVGLQRVTKVFIQNYSFPLPPLSEQQRIVQKLDALFARINEAIAHAERAMESIQSLLPAALNELFAESEQYEPISLLKHVEFIGGSQPPKDDFVYQGGPGLVRLIQIRDYKSDDHKVFIRQDSTKKFCKADDVMIGRYGPPVFQILKGLEGAYNVALMKAVPDEQFLSKEYLFWFLQNPNIQNYIIGISQRSAGQSGVNKDALEKYEISLPPLPTQNSIVRYISGLVKQIESIELSFAQKVNQLETLKQSLLSASFKANL